MLLKKIFTYSAFVALISASSAFAADTESHSVYRVTSYNFGALDGNSSGGLNEMTASFPLLITGYQSDILGDMNLDSEAFLTTPKSSATGGFALAAEYSPTEKFSVQGAFGITSSDWDPGTEENESSWEANLGIIYNLFNNVSYGVHFGYMETGDVYKRRDTYNDVESVIMVSNQLTLSF